MFGLVKRSKLEDALKKLDYVRGEMNELAGELSEVSKDCVKLRYQKHCAIEEHNRLLDELKRERRKKKR